MSEIIGKENFHHLGSLLLAFTMLWAYMAFSQLLVIWSGDLPHEISWYLHRIAGGWRWVLVFLVLFHFFGPFFLLLSRQMKQTRLALAAIAAAMFVAHVVDVWWMIVPSFYPKGIARQLDRLSCLCRRGRSVALLFCAQSVGAASYSAK